LLQTKTCPRDLQQGDLIETCALRMCLLDGKLTLLTVFEGEDLPHGDCTATIRSRLDGAISSNHKGRDHGLVVHCHKVHAPRRGLALT
jgi:hypothetical protein